jgi:hypothetical protein
MEKKLKAISKYGILTLESIGKDGLDELAKECEYLLCFKKN